MHDHVEGEVWSCRGALQIRDLEVHCIADQQLVRVPFWCPYIHLFGCPGGIAYKDVLYYGQVTN